MSMSGRMPVSEPVRRIEVFTGECRRRRWSAEDKAAIVAESVSSGETICGVARRHGLTPQQLFTWRRLARLALADDGAAPLFVPAVVEAVPDRPVPEPRVRRRRRRSGASGIELEIDGVTVKVGTGASPKAIAAVIWALKGGA